MGWRWQWLHLPVGVPIATDHRSSETISFPNHGFYETRLVRVIPQHHADLADSDVDAVIGIKENVLTPKVLSDLVARYEFPVPLDQKNEQLHREFFQAKRASTPVELVAAPIECEVAEMECLGHKSLQLA